MRRSVVVDTVARLVFHSALVLSVYLLFAGHNHPGGGFIGGLVAAAAFALIYVAGGIDDVRNVTRLRPWTVAGAGLLLSTVTAAAPLLVGDAVLESRDLSFDLPGLGHIKVTSTLIFDLGVYAIVVGLMLMIFEAVGEPEAGP